MRNPNCLDFVKCPKDFWNFVTPKDFWPGLFFRKIVSDGVINEMNLLLPTPSVLFSLDRINLSPRGYLPKFNTGRLHPEVQPLTLFYTILAEKLPLLYTFYEKRYPFNIPTLEQCIFSLSPWNEVNEQYYGKILSITKKKCYTNDKCYTSRCETTDSPTLLYTWTCEIPTLLYTWSPEKLPLSGRASPYRPL